MYSHSGIELLKRQYCDDSNIDKWQQHQAFFGLRFLVPQILQQEQQIYIPLHQSIQLDFVVGDMMTNSFPNLCFMLNLSLIHCLTPTPIIQKDSVLGSIASCYNDNYTSAVVILAEEKKEEKKKEESEEESDDDMGFGLFD